ncbi:MAG: TonB-dependent receptor [Bacteroidia bacterium]|nr:TonB-dependent receptor [Bacteroidia bacterium]
MKQGLLCLLLMLAGLYAQAQTQVTLSGYVKDAATGETLIGATVAIPAIRAGAYTNEYGFYSLTVPANSYRVEVRYVGYTTAVLSLNMEASLTLDHSLEPAGATLDEVVISAENAADQLSSTEMGVTTLSMDLVKKIPVFMGETDIMKTIQLLPGVKSAGEGSSGFFVRGGGADQNLILLDEAPVYNPSHLLGFFSVFNGDAIKSTKLYKGNMPAEYGGRLSSALDIRMKDGNSKDYGISGGIGLISSRLTVEGPIVEDQGSFMLSGRRTYADAFLPLLSDSSFNGSKLYFYDFNAKANYRLGEKDQLFLSGYFGRDAFALSDQFGINWGNATATLRWNHLFSDKLFLNSTFIYSDYDYEVNLGSVDASITSGIQDWNWKEDLSWYPNQNNTIKAGVNGIYHTFIPGAISQGEDAGISRSSLPERYALESAAYVSHEVSLSDRLKVNYGLRGSIFTVLGPGTTYSYDSEGNREDSTVYANNEVITNYAGLEPRLSTSYLLSETQSLKASYSRNRQYIHLLSNSTTSTPTDVWIPSSELVAPEIADQFSIGYFHNLKGGMYELSLEGYYKDLQNQIEYENGAQLLLDETVENQLVFGNGYAYGAELMISKTKGKLTGWVAYTWSRTIREFDDINNGDPFPARQDRIHDLSVVAIYDPNPRWSFSGSFVYNTGDAVTFPSGSYSINGSIVPLYTERNGYRLPDYHRLDLSATYYGKNPRSSWNASLYNAYGRKNVYTIDFQESETLPGSTEAVKTYLFQWVPSVTWNFDF